jgi:hypothetical protein
MNISERLEKWRVENNGIVETSATISIRSDALNITVQGKTLEDAYDKLAKIYGEPAVQATAKSNVYESIQPTFPQANTFQQDSTKDLQEILKGRQLMRVHMPSIPLGVGESTITHNGIQYVVK